MRIKILGLVCFVLGVCASLYADPLQLNVPEFSEDFDKILKKFERWVVRTTAKVESRSEVVFTPRGPIEYVIDGDKNGPVVLCLHGGFGGYDQGRLIGLSLAQHGFKVISPSRPGYLRTPLSVGQTNVEQAAAMVDLLNALGIPQVAVLGFSAGGPVAFEFATRYPERTWGLVLESIGSQPEQAAMYKLLEQILMLNPLADFASWLFYLALKHDPIDTSKFVLNLDSTLPPAQLKERIHYVLHSPSQYRFLIKLMLSTMPLGPRSTGLINDINNRDPWHTFNYALLHVPTIIIQSRYDSNGSYPEALFVSSQIPGSAFITVEESGHLLWLGPQTKQWERRLRQFLWAVHPSSEHLSSEMSWCE